MGKCGMRLRGTERGKRDGYGLLIGATAVDKAFRCQSANCTCPSWPPSLSLLALLMWENGTCRYFLLIAGIK